MGRDFAGEIARSHARFDFSSSYEAVEVATAFPELLDCGAHEQVSTMTRSGLTYGRHVGREARWGWEVPPPSGHGKLGHYHALLRALYNILGYFYGG